MKARERGAENSKIFIAFKRRMPARHIFKDEDLSFITEAVARHRLRAGEVWLGAQKHQRFPLLEI